MKLPTFKSGSGCLGNKGEIRCGRTGLLFGIVLTNEVAARVSDAALDAGFIINAPRPNVLRLAPPLIATPADLQPFLDALPGLLDRVS